MENKLKLKWLPMGREFDKIDGDQIVVIHNEKCALIPEQRQNQATSKHWLEFYKNTQYAILDIEPPPKKLTWEDAEAEIHLRAQEDSYIYVQTPYGRVFCIATCTPIDTDEWKKACAVNVVWRKIQELNDGWEPTFGAMSIACSLNYSSHSGLSINDDYLTQTRPNWQYLKSYEARQALMDSIEEETLKLALFS